MTTDFIAMMEIVLLVMTTKNCALLLNMGIATSNTQFSLDKKPKYEI